MKKSRATQNSLAHTQALLTLLQLHQYKELCYQFYLYVDAFEEDIVSRTTVMAPVGSVTSELTGSKFGNGAISAAFVHLFDAEYDTLGKVLKGLWNKKGEIAKAHLKAVIGGSKGVLLLFTMDASKVKGGAIRKGLFSYLTLKIASGSGAHIGYEIAPTSIRWWTRGYAYSNLLTYDTIYTVGNGEMYSVPETQCVDNQVYESWGNLYNE